MGVCFHASTNTLPAPHGPRLALLAGRTGDNPQLLRDVVGKASCTHILLEKPGAPTVGELMDMANVARAAGIPVFVDFNKNISAYVAKARAAEARTPGSQIKFVHLNAYS